MITTVSYPNTLIRLRKGEIARYARCSYAQANRQIDEAAAETEVAAVYRVCFDLFPIKRTDAWLQIGCISTQSEDLSRRLAGCEQAIVFAATVGVGIDRLIQKYNRLSPAKSIFLHAAGSEAAEALCNRFCADIAQKFGELRPRFSPGYGDLPLTTQKDVFTALSCTKNIGVTLSDSMLMLPSKSVTAIVGVISNVNGDAIYERS